MRTGSDVALKKDVVPSDPIAGDTYIGEGKRQSSKTPVLPLLSQQGFLRCAAVSGRLLKTGIGLELHIVQTTDLVNEQRFPRSTELAHACKHS